MHDCILLSIHNQRKIDVYTVVVPNCIHNQELIEMVSESQLEESNESFSFSSDETDMFDSIMSTYSRCQ